MELTREEKILCKRLVPLLGKDDTMSTMVILQTPENSIKMLDWLESKNWEVTRAETMGKVVSIIRTQTEP